MFFIHFIKIIVLQLQEQMENQQHKILYEVLSKSKKRC